MQKALAHVRQFRSITLSDEAQTELVRKSIHVVIATVPGLVNLFGVSATFVMLAAGTVFYTYAETLRLAGHNVAFVSSITAVAARKRDTGRFILGPVTLGVGAMLALLLYPEPAATLAIYALAFGDGIASLAGKLLGRTVLPGSGGKTVEGSVACLAIVFAASYAVTGLLRESLLIALAATALEMAPLKDMDNLVLPTGVGLLASQLLLV